LQTIWITGGSSGIGFAVASKFLTENWCVIISSRNRVRLSEAVKRLKDKTNKKNIHSIACDITKYEDVKKTIHKIEKEISPIDIALLNAAAYSPNKTQDFDIENYNLLINVNLKGTINCIDVLKNYMKNRGNHISVVSSPVGFRGMPTAGAYGMTKAAQLNLVESLYFDFKKLDIKVSVINPGFIDTESTKLNSFKMPLLKSPTYAAEKIYKGLTGKYKFEIYFPFIVVLSVKIMRILPLKLYSFIWKKLGNF
jgi:short-subunit dehydrogenase|tara:strand:- start:766 stop:1524 length:759 start_codon:yes stop_codon:yes gene_type:complete